MSARTKLITLLAVAGLLLTTRRRPEPDTTPVAVPDFAAQALQLAERRRPRLAIRIVSAVVLVAVGGFVLFVSRHTGGYSYGELLCMLFALFAVVGGGVLTVEAMAARDVELATDPRG